MAKSEIIVSVEVLEDLQRSLKAFRIFLLEHLRLVKAEMKLLRENLEGSRRDAAQHVRRCHLAIDNAADDEDTKGLYDELNEAEQGLYRVQRAQRRMHERAIAYEREAGGMLKIAENQLPRANGFLQQKAEANHRMLSLQSDGVATGFIGAAIQMTVDMFNTAIEALTDFAGTVLGAISGSFDFTNEPLPSDFRWMRLDEMNLEEALCDVKTADDFRSHASYGTMKTGLQTLREKVLPAIASHGYVADSFYFMRMDQKAGTEYENGTQRVYDAFFGSDSIAVQIDPVTSKFTVLNGRHRIKVAHDAQWLAVPVKVTQKLTR